MGERERERERELPTELYPLSFAIRKIIHLLYIWR